MWLVQLLNIRPFNDWITIDHLKTWIQWGSEYQTSLVFKWSKVVRPPNGLLFKCHLNTWLNLVWYSDHHFLIPDWYLNGGLNTELFEYWTSEYRTSESSLFRCFCYSDVCYSDPIPTVLWWAGTSSQIQQAKKIKNLKKEKLTVEQKKFFLWPMLGRPSTAGQKSTNVFSNLGRFTWHRAEI